MADYADTAVHACTGAAIIRISRQGAPVGSRALNGTALARALMQAPRRSGNQTSGTYHRLIALHQMPSRFAATDIAAGRCAVPS
jgi:hypothetical protein